MLNKITKGRFLAKMYKKIPLLADRNGPVKKNTWHAVPIPRKNNITVLTLWRGKIEYNNNHHHHLRQRERSARQEVVKTGTTERERKKKQDSHTGECGERVKCVLLLFFYRLVLTRLNASRREFRENILPRKIVLGVWWRSIWSATWKLTEKHRKKTCLILSESLVSTRFLSLALLWSHTHKSQSIVF